MQIAQNLKRIMEEKRVSINALERRAGVKPSAVQNIVYGRSKSPGINTIRAIAQALECSIAELIGSEASPSIENPSITRQWDIDLYVASLNTVFNLSKDRNSTLSSNDLFFCTEEIYRYSLAADKKQPDQDFAKWILDKRK